jgi:hypothetical protein
VFALGKDFNLFNQAGAGTTRVSLKNASGVTFVAIGATSSNCTVTEQNAASGGISQNLARVTTYWTQTNGVWTKFTQAAAATFPLTAAGITVAEIETTWLSDGFSYVSCSHGTGTVLHIVRGLQVQRAPNMLADLRA